MKGYYNWQELTDSALKDGWYHTGDLGKLDGDGFLYVVGSNYKLRIGEKYVNSNKNKSPRHHNIPWEYTVEKNH